MSAVAIIVLLLAFGSVVAMGLPIGTALMGIFVGAASVGILSAFLDVPEFSLILCAMIGLGVGIDYALFIVTRHRQHLHEGMSVPDAAGTAVATAGQAVLFAGTTVVIAILGLFLAGLPAISGMGAAVALVVTVSMIAAITLLPGLLGLAGTKIDKLSIHRKTFVEKAPEETVAGRWAHHVGNHPVRYAVAGLVAMCAIAVPALSMRIGVPDDGNAPTHTTQRIAYDQLAAGFGPGFNGPILVVVELPASGGPAVAQRVHDAVAADPGVAAVTEPVLNADGDTAVLTVNPTTAPQDEGTDQLVRHLRSDVLPATVEGTEARVSLTGQAMVTDLSDRITERLPIFIAAVVAMSFLLLMIVFRSVLVPLKAALMNLLSIAAAYGVLVAVFQWGWGARAHRPAQHDADQPVPAAHHVRHPLRALDGLRGVPPVPDPGGVRGDRRQPRGRGAGPVEHRSGDHVGRPHHDQRVRSVRPRRRPERQALRRRPRRRRAHRRHARAHGAGAGNHEPARPGQLVAAGLARPDPPAPRPRGRAERA